MRTFGQEVFMPDFGKRLRQERLRLGFSQAMFAEACGIKRTAQTTYESGKRSPDVDYLEAAGNLGIDIDYVIFGIPNPETPVDCPFVQEQHLDLQYVFTLQHCRDHAAGEGLTSSPMAVRWWKACDECPKNPIKHGLPIAQTPADIDWPLLLALLEGLETALLRAGLAMVPAKKAHAVVMLYRAFKASGKVDQKIIEEAVQLAAG
ncbi:helix-turn-helix domain-containing protein [Sulfuriferula multivorans]|nr:helix-turn-helix transcriptional regulator [Sulfuriferula multivorans]